VRVNGRRRGPPGHGGFRAGDVSGPVAADARQFQNLLRELTPQVLATLIRRSGQFAACEDAVQEALLDASIGWPATGIPDNPRAWLVTVASRRLIDHYRSDSARRRREDVELEQRVSLCGSPADELRPGDADDTLTLLFLCCHPLLPPAAQAALTLWAVGGLTTAQIAGAFFVLEATMAQRISRAKQRIRSQVNPFRLPQQPEWMSRLSVVLQVLYLIFNEGYCATTGPDLNRTELTAEAMRLTRAVHALLPGDGEVTGLLALMLLTDARRPARSRTDGNLVPLAEQDRTFWRHDSIAEGVQLITGALTGTPLGPYQLQATIAAFHDEATDFAGTDWAQIVGLYRLLVVLSPGPVVLLNQAVAVAMPDGPTAGLHLVAQLADDERISGSHRLEAVRRTCWRCRATWRVPDIPTCWPPAVRPAGRNSDTLTAGRRGSATTDPATTDPATADPVCHRAASQSATTTPTRDSARGS